MCSWVKFTTLWPLSNRKTWPEVSACQHFSMSAFQHFRFCPRLCLTPSSFQLGSACQQLFRFSACQLFAFWRSAPNVSPFQPFRILVFSFSGCQLFRFSAFQHFSISAFQHFRFCPRLCLTPSSFHFGSACQQLFRFSACQLFSLFPLPSLPLDHPHLRMRHDEFATSFQIVGIFAAEEIEEVPREQQIIVRLFRE